MIYDEKWSYAYGRIREYLLEQGAREHGDVFDLADCTVTLEALPDRKVGELGFEQTRVRIEGPGADDFYHHHFKLKFLSGGA